MDQLKAEVVEAVAILELQELEGRKKLPKTPLHALAVVSEYGECIRLWCINRVQVLQHPAIHPGHQCTPVSDAQYHQSSTTAACVDCKVAFGHVA
jgi:hypothetical protein